jgi:HK97 family phage major capsid protein
MNTSSPSKFTLERAMKNAVAKADSAPRVDLTALRPTTLLEVASQADFNRNLASLQKSAGRRYSLVRALSGLLTTGKPDAALELEVDQELRLLNDRSVDPGSIIVPLSAFSVRADLDTSSPPVGGSLVPTKVEQEVIPFLRYRSVVGRLGGKILSLPPGNAQLGRMTSSAGATWSAETANTVSSGPLFDNFTLTPSRITATTIVSRQLLRQATPDVERLVIDDITASIANEIDRVVLNGSGTSPEPSGILAMTPNAAGQYKYNLRSPDIVFGGAASWAKVVSFESTLDGGAQVHSDGSYGWVGAPDVREKWMTVPKVSTYPDFLWSQPDNEQDGRVAGRLAISTSQMPVGRVIFGRWSDALIVNWEGAEVLLNPYTFASTFEVQIRVTMLATVGFRYSSAFITSSDSASQ